MNLYETYNNSSILLSIGQSDYSKLTETLKVIKTEDAAFTQIKIIDSDFIIYDNGENDKVLLDWTSTSYIVNIPKGITEINKDVFA